MQFDRVDAFAVGAQSAGDLDLPRGAAWLDAKGGRCELDDDAFDQRIAHTTIGFDAAADTDLADRLADLNADRAIGMGHDAVELRRGHGPRIDVEAPRALAESLDWRFDLKRSMTPKLTKPMPLGPNEVTLSSATQRSTVPQLSSTMSFGTMGSHRTTVSDKVEKAPWTTNTPPEMRSGVPAAMPPSL